MSRPEIILDLMGGDRSPLTILDGAEAALPLLRGSLRLIGKRELVDPLLKKRRLKKLSQALRDGVLPQGGSIAFTQASEIIEMEDSIKAIRTKKDASINIGCKFAAEAYDSKKKGTGPASAFVSTGHSGAMMASSLLNMGRIKGIERPGIAVTLPTLGDHGCVVLDVGANVDCKPEHLRDFALMGALFAGGDRTVAARKRLPRVGVLSNGEERSKGNELARAALELIETMPYFKAGPASVTGGEQVGQFVGFVEGKDIFKGHVDVVVTDGFVGNVVLKSVEGLGLAVVSLLKQAAKRSPLSMLGFLLAAGALRGLKQKLDYAEYGAAPLLGVAGYAFICHGSSNAKAIKNALLRAQDALENDFITRLENALTPALSVNTPSPTGATSS